MSLATVIGPTPPGTGVMKDATLEAEAKSTSPTSRCPDFLEASEGVKEEGGDESEVRFRRDEVRRKGERDENEPGMKLVPTSMTTHPGLSHSPLTK